MKDQCWTQDFFVVDSDFGFFGFCIFAGGHVWILGQKLLKTRMTTRSAAKTIYIGRWQKISSLSRLLLLLRLLALLALLLLATALPLLLLLLLDCSVPRVTAVLTVQSRPKAVALAPHH